LKACDTRRIVENHSTSELELSFRLLFQKAIPSAIRGGEPIVDVPASFVGCWKTRRFFSETLGWKEEPGLLAGVFNQGD
jgi:hypothetical protein